MQTLGAHPLHVLAALSIALLAACQGSGVPGTPTPAPSLALPSSPTRSASEGPAASAAALPSPDPRLAGGIVFERALSADDNQLGWTDGVTTKVIRSPSIEAVLAPDGRTFIDTLPTATGVGATLFDLDGGSQADLPNPDSLQLDGSAAWSPDSRRVVSYSWSETDPSTNGLYARSVATPRDVVRLTMAGNLLEHPLAFAPNGSQLLFSRRLEPGSKHGAPQDLYVVPATGGAATRINPPGTSVGLYWSIKPATWSPDGTQITFAAHSDDPDLAGVWVVDADGANPRRIAAIGIDQYTYAHWSPDGAWITTAPALTTELLRPDGSDRHAIAGVEGTEQWFGGIWSPDSSSLLSMRYTGMVLAHADLWVVGVDGSDALAVTHRAGTYTNFAWAPR